MATIEKRYLSPLNPSTTLTEADRSKVNDMIRQELADRLAGNQSYYPDGVQKDPNARVSELKNFITSIAELQGHVNDPSNILGRAIDDLGEYAKAFQAITEGNEPVDHIEMPQEWSPATKDMNEMYVPDLGPFSPPNPLSPNQWPKDLKASTRSSDDVVASGATPDSYPRLVSRIVSAGRGSIDSSNVRQLVSALQSGRPLGIFSGVPMPDFPLPPSIRGSDSSGNRFTRLASAPQQSQGSMSGLPAAPAVPLAPSSNPTSMGGLAGRIAAVAGIDPDNPEQPVPPVGGLLGLLLSSRR